MKKAATARAGERHAVEVSSRSRQSGIALLLVLLLMLCLSGLAVAVALFAQSRIRLTKTVEVQTQAYYAALAGLEEARGRLNPTALDRIDDIMYPKSVNQVLYLVNSSSQDPVHPTDALSPYYDSEYASEFPGGFSGAQVLGLLSSDQPGAGTSQTIPYKWVRVTLKTERSSNTDVDQNGTLDSTTPIYWDGSNQDLAPHGFRVYTLTALSVEPGGIRKMVQMEVAGTPPLKPPSGMGTAASASLTGMTTFTNLVIDGTDACAAQNVVGVAAGGTISTSGQTSISGTPSATQQNRLPFPEDAAALIQSLQPMAVPIRTADPSHVTLSSDGTTLVGTNVVLGQQAVGPQPAQPLIVYADRPLRISGSYSAGDGMLLVNGDLSIRGGFNYRGVIVAQGTATLANSWAGSVLIDGTLLSSGNLAANSTHSNVTSLRITYDSCAIADTYQTLPLATRAFKELSF